MAALYPNSPDGRPTIGSEHEIAELTRESAMDFYRAHYAPNNAILVVAGDVDTDEVRRLAEQHFGPIPASALVAPRQRPQEPPHRAARRIEMHDARVAVAQLTRLYLAPQRRAGDQKEAAALVVLADLLGGDAGHFGHGDATSWSGTGSPSTPGPPIPTPGSMRRPSASTCVPKPGVELAEAEAALDALIARFIEQGPDPAEIDRIKGRVRAAEIYVLDDVSGRANRIGAALTSGLTLDDVDAWPDLLQSVTAEDVKAAAAAVFRIENSVTGWLMPPDARPQEPPQ